ncbi:OprD family porin [Entomomonas asaccharolytica]|uniref:OprD family porin n=1 Tax=Entomomonas asaccharolytica TaxID=2785331 RepID=A0A974NHI2_9GAMM|nr:OprD family porin [Entomomonas asaccharolytica]QQP86714.1 OprD family porin [Entomomonas asaccharolytica]
MNKAKLNLLAVTITTLIPTIAIAEQQQDTSNSILNQSAQAESAGFLEDSNLNVLIRNVYFNRDFRNSSNSNMTQDGKERQSYREEWAQGFIATYESGFTQGTVGFGVDAFGMYGFKLDTGRGRNGAGLLPIDSHGKAENNYAKASGAVKMRLSNTTLKYGEQIVDTPVFATDDARLFPETAEGFLLTSNEIKNLTINAGHFTSLRAMNQTYRDSIDNGWGLYNYRGTGLKRADFIGGTYQFTDNLSASLYYSDVKDFWKKKYVGLDYAIPIDEKQAVNFSFNYYNTKSQGPVKHLSRQVYNGDKINSNVWSLQASYTYDAHKFTLAHQRVTGDGPGNPYGVDGGGAIYLANSVQYSDFNNENERSWQARYDLDMSKYGAPGLSFMTRYIRGTNISEYLRDSNKSGGKVTESEHNIEAKYVVQEGPAKDLSVRVRYAIYRSSGFSDDVNELRIITEYPWDLMGMFKK